jgi:hypothetical protein
VTNDWRGLAAHNNAELCDAVARTHGLEPRFDADAWTSARRTPLLYPDGISLTIETSAADLLAQIDSSPGCSIKDSYAALDLAPHGFRVLFEAQWIVRTPDPAPAPGSALTFEPVRDASRFAEWENAWRGADGPVDVLRPALLHEQSITVAAARRSGEVVAGAIFNRSAEVVGISNLFGPADARDGALACAAAAFPERTLVGYESAADLDHAVAAGFETAGPLRVWIN